MKTRPGPDAGHAAGRGGGPQAGQARGTAGDLGEYEQRSTGARGTGQPGELRSRNALLEALQRRISDDPSLAGCRVRVEVGAQGVEIVGDVAEASQHARLRALVEASGVALLTDRVQVRARGGGSGP